MLQMYWEPATRPGCHSRCNIVAFYVRQHENEAVLKDKLIVLATYTVRVMNVCITFDVGDRSPWITWLDVLAMLLHICAASFCQKHVIPEIIDLHLFEVKYLILAFLQASLAQ